MRLLWSGVLRLAEAVACTVLCMTGLPACSLDSALDAYSGEEPATGIAGPNATIAVEGDETLALTPGEVTSITIATSPPDHYEISFSLLGESVDASLDNSTVVANAGGRASVQLRAPNSATTFRVRASVKDGPSAELQVAVSGDGFGAIRVVPMYLGHRPVAKWTASVTKATCASLVDILPMDPEGAIADTAAGDSAPLIQTAPVGPNLAVALRAGHFLWGCADEAELIANATLDVEVKVFDRPIDLLSSELDLDFNYDPPSEAYDALLTNATTLLIETFAPPGQTDAILLLNSMEKLVEPSAVYDFQAKRETANWAALVGAHFAEAQLILSERVEHWITTGLNTEPRTLRGRLSSSGDEAGQAAMWLDTIGTLVAVDAGIGSMPCDATWTADTTDTVHMAGTVSWLPTRFVGALALAAVEKELSVESVPEALATVANCHGVAEELGAFGSCDSDCIEALCEDALASRWESALDASLHASQIGSLDVTASGLATVDDGAALVSFDGSWLGDVTDGSLSATLEGPVSATTTETQGLPY